MKIGVSTGFSDRLKITAEQAVDIIASTPFKTIELWTMFYGKYKHFDWEDTTQVMNLRKKLEEYKIQVNSIHAPFSYDYELPTDNKVYFSALIKDIKNVILTSAELNASFVVIHPASRPNTSRKHVTIQQYQQKFNSVKYTLAELIEFIEKNNLKIKIALENQLPHIMFGFFDELEELIKILNNKTVGICFDTSHAMMAYNNNTDILIKNIEAISEFIITTHISDTDGTTDAHLLLGEGKIEWYKLTTVFSQMLKNEVPLIVEILTPLKDKTMAETLNEAYKRVSLLRKDWW